jgi:hypothetical protein
MGSKMDKLEKKRLKAQIKLEKKRLKEQQIHEPQVTPTSKPEPKPDSKASSGPKAKIPWYEDPGWIRALAAVLSLIVAIIALFVMLYR